MDQNIKKQIDYLLKLTDKIGIIEHCHIDEPNYLEGYCVDDNARALQVCLRLKNEYPVLKKVMPIYFNFLKLAIKNEKLFNDLNPDLSWQNEFGKGEHYGRTLAAFGESIKFESNLSSISKDLFDQIYKSFDEKKSPHNRVLAQIILGLRYYKPEEIKFWADSLVNQYTKEKNDSWKWFEPVLSYDIGRIPLALLVAYQITKNKKYLNVALESLNFLTEMTFDKKLDCFVFPGNKGWFNKSGTKIIFDQQPLEAGSVTEAYSLAFQITKNKKYKELALKAFAWYDGKNILKVNMVNQRTGGVHDGFNNKEINLNQGAESILSYLLAYNAVKLIKTGIILASHF